MVHEKAGEGGVDNSHAGGAGELERMSGVYWGSLLEWLESE